MKIIRIFIIVLIASLFLASCQFSVSVSTASVKESAMTTGIDKDGKNIDQISSYKPSDQAFTVVTKVVNAPDNTKVTFKWLYINQSIDIDAVSVEMSGSRYVNSTLNRGKIDWPLGDYEVHIYINDNKEPAAKVPFKVAN